MYIRFELFKGLFNSNTWICLRHFSRMHEFIVLISFKNTITEIYVMSKLYFLIFQLNFLHHF